MDDSSGSNDLARRPEPGRRGAPSVVLVLDAVFAGVGSLYLLTGSVTIVALAAGLTVLIVWCHRRDG
jgi:hypothetical protein